MATHNTSAEQQQDRYRNHTQVWELLPWYLSESLPAEDEQRVSEHITVCLTCRKELRLQASLRESVKNYELDELMVAASFDRLSEKLRGQDEELAVARHDPPSTPATRTGSFTGALKRWLQQRFTPGYFAAAMAAVFVVVLLPVFNIDLLPGNNTFRTLSNVQTEAAVAADFRLIFADGVSGRERDAILENAGLRIVAGPDERGLYFVSAADSSGDVLAATLEQLQGNGQIMFAEFAADTAPDGPPSGER